MNGILDEAWSRAEFLLLKGFHLIDQSSMRLSGRFLRQLNALDTARLRDIVRAYELLNAEDAEKATRLDLATAIITAARVAASRI